MRILLADTLINGAPPTYALDPGRGGGIEGLCTHLWGKQATDWVLPILWSIARKYPRVVVGEIGTCGGMSAGAFGMAARDVGGRVYTMDIDTQYLENAKANVKLFGVEDYVTFITADSRATDFPEPLDVLFIDGDHSYEGVKADYERHAKNVKPNGTILLHDPMSCEGVGEFCLEVGAHVIPIEAGLAIMSKGHHMPRGYIQDVTLGPSRAEARC